MSVATVPYKSTTSTIPTGSLVESRFLQAQDLANTNMADVDELLQQIAAQDFTVPMADIESGVSALDAPNLGDAPQATRPGAFVPGMVDVALGNVTDLRNSLGLETISLTSVTFPDLTAEAPSLSIPSQPSTDLPEIPSDVPTVGETDLPEAPSITLPDAPTFDSIAIPEAQAVAIPTFSEEAPVYDLEAPEPMFVYSEDTYRSDLKDALVAKLLHDVQYGGTGLDAEVEAAIIARAIDTLDVELEKAVNKTLDLIGSMGHEFPPGALAANLRQDMAASNRERTNLARDIVRLQAELAQKNTLFAVEQGLAHEKIAMDYANQVNQRAFEVAKYTLQAAIDVFNAKVVAFNARMEGYKVKASVYDSLIRAELSKVEVFKAQIEGAKLQADIQVAMAEVYSRRVQALQTVIDLYRAQMEGAKIQSETERLRIEAYRTQVEAVTAQIQGRVAAYNLYQAQISGEEAKVRIYTEQVGAFKTQVDAVKAQADLQLAEAQVITESNKDKIAVLQAAIEQYKAEAQVEATIEETRVKAYAADVDAYQADVQARLGHQQALIDRYKAQIQEADTQIGLLIKEAEVNSKTALAGKEILAELLKSTANIKAQLAASSMSAVSASAQVGFHESLGNSYSADVRNSYTETKSLE